MSDDTTHDASFVHEVLEDIFNKWGIENENVMIKSDNAQSQYKDLYAFWSLQYLADKYNVQIVRVYGAAGHGKGLIDAMSSFGVKSILRRDIVTTDQWFQNSKEICDYLSIRGDHRMEYVHLDAKMTDERRCNRQGKPIHPCKIGNLFFYKPKCESVLMREYLCDCEQCLSLTFEKCIHAGLDQKHKPLSQVDSNGDDELIDDECELDEDYDDVDKVSLVYEFIECSCIYCISII